MNPALAGGIPELKGLKMNDKTFPKGEKCTVFAGEGQRPDRKCGRGTGAICCDSPKNRQMIKEDQLLPMTKKDQGLKWLPWIGEDYFTLALQKRLLIVGESYFRPEGALIDYSMNSHCIKWMIEDVAAGQQGFGKEFEDIQACVTGRADGDRMGFWNQMSFHEFIQRPLESRREVPSGEEFESGWKIFSELIEILKPGLCLFTGTRAAGFLEAALSEPDRGSLLSLQTDDAVDGIHPMYGRMKTTGGQEIKLLFIRDAAGPFNAEAWHGYLTEREGLIREFREKPALNTH